MVQPKRASKAAALVFGVTTCICLACGGASTVGVPTRAPSDPAISAANQAWADWKQGPGQFLDQDFFDCYELNNAPRPTIPTPEDPSGHTRGRRGCDEAIQAVVAALPDYERLAAVAQEVPAPTDASLKAQFDALLKARTTRLQWAENLVVAAQKNDTNSLQTLRKQIPGINTLESAALGIDLSKLPTQAPRPTLPFIPGVPTPTPKGR